MSCRLESRVTKYRSLARYRALLSDQSADRPPVYLSPSVLLSVGRCVLSLVRLHVPLAPIATINEHFSCPVLSLTRHTDRQTDRRTERQTTTRHLAKYKNVDAYRHKSLIAYWRLNPHRPYRPPMSRLIAATALLSALLAWTTTTQYSS